MPFYGNFLQGVNCVKSVQIRSFFLVRIQSEYWKIRTRKYSVFGHFSHSDYPSCFNNVTGISSFYGERSSFRRSCKYTKDRLSPNLSEQWVKLLHNIMIYFSCQINKNKSKNNSLCSYQLALEKM